MTSLYRKSFWQDNLGYLMRAGDFTSAGIYSAQTGEVWAVTPDLYAQSQQICSLFDLIDGTRSADPEIFLLDNTKYNLGNVKGRFLLLLSADSEKSGAVCAATRKTVLLGINPQRPLEETLNAVKNVRESVAKFDL